MTNEEFREAVERLEMNQDQAAGFLGVTQGSISRWATGVNPVPGPVAKALELALAQHEQATR
jgi:DNA-binding transcriptional regulator YiaG